MPGTRTLRSSAAGVVGLLPAAATVYLLSACAGYVEPKPGMYRAVGQAQVDRVCSYEAPTGMMALQWRCRKPEDIAQGSEDAQEYVLSIPTKVPPPP